MDNKVKKIAVVGITTIALYAVINSLNKKVNNINNEIEGLKNQKIPLVSNKENGLMPSALFAQYDKTTYNTKINISDNFSRDLEASWQAANNFSCFEGFSFSQTEGRFWGVKKKASTQLQGCALCLMNSQHLIFARRIDGNWYFNYLY